MSLRADIARDLLRKFPSAATKTLAAIAYRDNKSLFSDIEAARHAIRYQRGADGDAKRKHTAGNGFERISKPGDPFAAIPDGKTHFKDWGPFELSGPANALIISDTHIPYHEKTPLVAALDHGRKNGVDTVILNGDTVDFFSVSFWEKDPRKRNLAEEIKTAREFLKVLRGMFKKARIIFKDGNHEERWERYLRVKAPEVLGMEEFELPAVLKFADVGIEDYVTEKRRIALGDLTVMHGHEYKFAISNPVSAARGLFLRTKSHAICAHFHQKSEHGDKNVKQESIATWSTGCLCDMHPDYAPYNNWAHGFAMVQVDKQGRFRVQNKFIAGGQVY